MDGSSINAHRKASGSTKTEIATQAVGMKEAPPFWQTVQKMASLLGKESGLKTLVGVGKMERPDP